MINFIEISEYESFLEESVEIISDIKDIEFIALALRLGCPIWSNDLHFKEQSIIQVVTTAELIKKLLSGQI